jgi:hypothetical protein
MRHQDESEASYAIHEVYYDSDGKMGWTQDPVGVVGSSLEEMHDIIGMMIEAFKKPVLDYKTGEKVLEIKKLEETQ